MIRYTNAGPTSLGAGTQFDHNATFHDGSCPTLFFGCIDPSAANYREYCGTADVLCEDDGSCVYAGCTDPQSLNYDSAATLNDGACVRSVPGCTDSRAINYYASANVDSGCHYAGCTDSRAPSFDPSATANDGSCETIFVGCTDSLALNFSPMYNWPARADEPGECAVRTDVLLR